LSLQRGQFILDARKPGGYPGWWPVLVDNVCFHHHVATESSLVSPLGLDVEEAHDKWSVSIKFKKIKDLIHDVP
jgi:hypothetical protein